MTERKKKPRSSMVEKSIPLTLEKAEETEVQQQIPHFIKTRGQLEEEMMMAEREQIAARVREEKAIEAARYSKYFRVGLFLTIAGGVAFLGYRYSSTIKHSDAVTDIVSGLSAAK